MPKKYIDINGYVSLCNDIDKNNPIIECLTDNNPDEPLCDTAVRFPDGCVSLPWGYYYGGYYYGYYARTYGLTFMKISYDIPDSIRRKYIPGSRFLETNCGNDYQIGLVVPDIQAENFTYGCPLLGLGTWDSISLRYQATLCKENNDGETYVRTANCKSVGCPSYLSAATEVCQEKQGDLRLQTCCVGAEECAPEDEGCILIATRIEKTFEVDYEIVRRASLCAESIPEIPEKGCGSMMTAADSSYLGYHNKCEHSGQEDCDPVTNSRGISISHGCASTSDDCPPNSPGPFWSLVETFLVSKTVQYEKKDCDCACSTCIKCSDLESEECLNYTWNGYTYAHNSYIGTNCCGPSIGWYWSYNICSSNAGPNDTPAEDTGEPSCREPAPNWIIVDACDTDLIEDYEGRECFTRGPNFTRNSTYVPPPPSSSNECLKDDQDTGDPPPTTTREYASFKPKQCEMGLVEILRSRLVHRGVMPSNLQDYTSCRSQIIATGGYYWWQQDGWCFADFECEPAEELCYTNEQIFIVWPYVYKPSEVVDTATATATVTYCQMSITNCTPAEE